MTDSLNQFPTIGFKFSNTDTRPNVSFMSSLNCDKKSKNCLIGIVFVKKSAASEFICFQASNSIEKSVFFIVSKNPPSPKNEKFS